MNKLLLTKLAESMTEENRRSIIRLINESDGAEAVKALVENQELVAKISSVAASYVHTATAAVSINGATSGNWDLLIGSSDIATELVELLKNASCINYTQAVVIITAALLEDDK